MTIGGVTATLHANIAFGARVSFIACVAGATVSTGTTATVVATFSGTISSCALYVTAIDGLTSTTAVTTDTGSGGTGVTNASTGATLTYPTGGFVVGVATKAQSTTTTWTGPTKQSEGTFGTTVRTISNADLLPTSTTTGNTAQVSYPVNGQQCLAVASFR